MLRRYIALFFLGSLLSSPFCLAEQTCYYPAHIDVGGYYFTKSPHGTALVDIFAPIFQSPTEILYADLRGLEKSGAAIEGNFGLGVRSLNLCKDRMLGLYSFYDYKRSEIKNNFQQVTVGGEVWWRNWFLGANGYIPFGRTTQAAFGLDGAETRPAGAFRNIFFRTGSEVALPGFDGAVGYEVVSGLTAYLGGYYYKRSNVSSVAGPFGRVRYIYRPPCGKRFAGIFDSIYLETQLQHDDQRGTLWYGGIRFTLNFSKLTSACLSRVARHMVEPVLRDLDIVSVGEQTPFQRLNNPNGSPVNVLDVSSQAAIESAVANSNVDVIAVQGTISNLDNLTLGAGQTVTGAAFPFIADGRNFSVLLSNGGSLVSASTANLLQVTSNNTVRDITLTLTNPANDATSNRAIYNDTSVDAMGNIIVENITTNGAIYINRDGAAQSGFFGFCGSQIDIGSWDPTGIPAVVELDVNNGGSITGDIQGNTVLAVAPTAQVVGLRLSITEASTATIQNLANNTIRATDAGVVNFSGGGSTITYQNGIANNVIESTLPGEIPFFCFGLSSLGITDSIIFQGAIRDNTMFNSNGGNAFVLTRFGQGNISYRLLGGITGNTFTGGMSLSTSGSSDSMFIAGFRDNEISAINLTVNTTDFTIDVESGDQGLSAANSNATVSIGGSETPTINPGV